jgi:hypothetical protein
VIPAWSGWPRTGLIAASAAHEKFELFVMTGPHHVSLLHSRLGRAALLAQPDRRGLEDECTSEQHDRGPCNQKRPGRVLFRPTFFVERAVVSKPELSARQLGFRIVQPGPASVDGGSADRQAASRPWAAPAPHHCSARRVGLRCGRHAAPLTWEARSSRQVVLPVDDHLRELK